MFEVIMVIEESIDDGLKIRNRLWRPLSLVYITDQIWGAHQINQTYNLLPKLEHIKEIILKARD